MATSILLLGTDFLLRRIHRISPIGASDGIGDTGTAKPSGAMPCISYTKVGDALPLERTHPAFGAALDGIAQLHFETEEGLKRIAENPAVQV